MLQLFFFSWLSNLYLLGYKLLFWRNYVVLSSASLEALNVVGVEIIQTDKQNSFHKYSLSSYYVQSILRDR